MAHSRALIDLSRPTKSGTTMWGNTTTSLKGSNGYRPSSISGILFLFKLNMLGIPYLVLVQEQGGAIAVDHLFVDHTFPDSVHARDIVHDVQHHGLQNGPKTAGARLPFERIFGYGLERFLRELETHAFHLKEFLVLLHERISRLRENPGQRVQAQLIPGGQDRQPAAELGNHAILDQVLRLNKGHDP